MKIKIKLQLTFFLVVALILSGCLEESQQLTNSTDKIKILNNYTQNYTNETNPTNNSNDEILSIPLEKPPFID